MRIYSAFFINYQTAMSEPIITVENVSKCYLVGHRQGHFRYTALRDVIGRDVRKFARKAIDVVRGRQVVMGDEVEEFWALKNVGFEVKQGEVLGIIGRNGAGKSTLLKILSRITEPTEGRVVLRGGVASLLEVGTGFHPELTGRENIFLNGAILGMTRAEIRRKFDEIVDFAEVEKFLDTPVKRYSSGMYVRLAFAVAAHLEPEILIVDEVLAVGDAEFQKKCLGKMEDVSRGGRTVLFVSHNMAAVERLTSQAVLLRDGTVQLHGKSSLVVETYLASVGAPTTGWVDVETEPRKYQGIGSAIISKLRLHDSSGVVCGGQIMFDLLVKVLHQIDQLRVSFTIFDLAGMPVGSAFSNEINIANDSSSLILTITMDRIPLAPGEYYMGVSIGRGDFKSGHIDYDVVLDCMYFSVAASAGRYGMLPTWERSWGSIVFDGVTLDISEPANAA
jgi:lipopolysaccharide transport system ATP-binding protein